MAAEILQQRQKIQEMARGYRQAQVLFTCIQLGVFEVLEPSPASADEIAKVTGTSERGMELLLNAAAALGLLEKKDARFVNSPLAKACLVSDSPGDISTSLQLEMAFYPRWEHLSSAVQTGCRSEEPPSKEQSAGWVRGFIQALDCTARPIAPLIAETLALPETQPIRVLDVGGGHGRYSIALAQRYPHLHATVFELPPVVPIAREIIAQAGLTERVDVQEGNFQTDSLGRDYDVALLFGVLNGEAPAGRQALIQKVADALNPGGKIVIRDPLLNADRAGPIDATLTALHMLLSTDQGGLDTYEDRARWLQSAGFTPPQPVPVPDGMDTVFMVAIKRSTPSALKF